MPRITRGARSRPGDPKPVREKPSKYICTRCGKEFKIQKGNFPATQSPLFRENGGYLTICGHCVDDLYDHYKSVLGGGMEAIHRLCMKLDIYWNPKIYATLNKSNTTGSRIKTYISRTNLNSYIGKSYDDTLDEAAEVNDGLAFAPEMPAEPRAEDEEECEYTVEPEVMEFWGSGFSPEAYRDLETRYANWTADLAAEPDKSTEALYKQICILEYTISRNAAAGKPIETTVNALNNVLGSANLKPVQQKDDTSDAEFEGMPFGVGIKMCENRRPIPKPHPELEDVDGVVRYISIWFLGHLCKMLGIRNTYCRLYEEEMQRLRVEREISEDEDDESAFDDIFGDSGGDSA